MTIAGQTAVSYTWDNANRLTGITQGSTSVGLAYDNANRRTSLTLPNGIVLAYSYDHDSRVTGTTWTLGSSPVGDLEYSDDADGHVTGRTGSFAQSNTPTPVSGNAFNADNAMTGFNGTMLTYDATGNLIGDGTNTYTWDARNHLTGISGAATASFVYDGFGRRMSKAIGGTTTQYLYDGLDPVQELDGSSPPNATANLLTGLGTDEYFRRTDGSGAMSFLADALGSTVALTDSGGALNTQYTYEPYGKTTASGHSNASSYQYTGRENDGTGLYFYRARYYSPAFQRFVSQDPIGFAAGDPNLYEYVLNSPPNLKDPLGLFWFVVPVAPGGGVPLYYAMHFQDDPMTNGNLPDSPGVYDLPGLSCGYFFCVVPDDQFNQDLNPPDYVVLNDLPSDAMATPGQSGKSCR